MQRDYFPLITQITAAYERRFPRSQALNREALRYLVDGGSHALRLMQPFPPRVRTAAGAWFTDEDGHRVLDFWQGHLANILGHNPPVITNTLADAFKEGYGLLTGLTDTVQIEAAELLSKMTGSERVRFTTSGTLATMYAIFLARDHTGRGLVLKVGGGWHGANPWGLVGYRYRDGFEHVDSKGLPKGITDQVLVTRFNDPGQLEATFKQHGDEIAAFMVEPVVGAGGLIPAVPEYLQLARELTQKHGALLILDEVIAGFRFHAGDTGGLYGIVPDMTTFGKIIGGGMPVAAVAGRAEILDRVGRESGSRVKFSGGTYSAHPASMLAARTMLRYLAEHENEIYPNLAETGELVRAAFERAFASEGILCRCTGGGNRAIPGSSLVMAHFPYDESIVIDSPDVAMDPTRCDYTLSHGVLRLALLLEDVHLVNAHGIVTTEHTPDDIAILERACQRVARQLKPYF